MNDDEAEISAIISRMFEDFRKQTPFSHRRTFARDATVWDVFVPQLIQGEEERVAFHEADRAQSRARGTLSLEISQPLVTVWENMALARYYLTFEYAPPNATSGRIRISTLFRREDGAWHIVHHHEGMVPGGVPPIS